MRSRASILARRVTATTASLYVGLPALPKLPYLMKKHIQQLILLGFTMKDGISKLI
jgi:hypothetical protein